MVGGVEKWGTAFTADTWFNFAYDIEVRLSYPQKLCKSHLICDCSSPRLLLASGLQQTLPHSPRLFKTLLLRHLPIRPTGIWVSFVS